MRKRLKSLFSLAVATACVVAIVMWQPWADDATVVDLGIDRAIAESVSVRTLTDEITIRGELRRDELQVVTAAVDGKVGHVSVEDGDTVKAGDALLTIDGRELVAVLGDFAFYRQLDVGSEGPDVRQLEDVLSSAGYQVGDVDSLYTEETRSGLAAWQADHGYIGAAPEADEVVTVTLQGNPAGYVVGPVNAVSVRIGPAVATAGELRESQSAAVMSTVAAVVDAAAVADTPVPTVNLTSAAVVVQEGRPVVVTISADVAPVADLEIPITISGDVMVGDDYVDPDDTIVLPAGNLSVVVEIETLLDDDREPYEDLKVAIGGGFESLVSVAPQNLVVYDARKLIDDLELRVNELVDDISEERAELNELDSERLIRTDVEADLVSRGIITDAQAYKIDVTPAEASNLTTLEKAERDAAERLSLDLIRTPVEADLVSRGIITDAQAYKIDVTPAEASNLITLERAEKAAINGLALGQVTYAEHLAAVQKYANALEAAVADVSVAAHAAAVQEYADALEAAVAESVELTATRDALEVLEDEQKRLDYRLAAARETLRVAQAARYVLGDSVEVTVSIDDPDVPDVPILVLRADSETVTESGMATFTIETTVELVEDLDVFYVVEGSATADADFNAPDGDITMKVGQERVTLSIPVRSDDDVEGDETLTVRLSADPAGSYRLSDRDQATMLIESSDLPELTLEGGGEVGEGDTAVVTIVADQAPDTDTSVHYQVSGSAQAGQDYAVVTGTALLRAGQRSVTVEIRTINDDVVFMPGDMVVADWPVRVGTVSVVESDYVQRGTPLFDLTEPVFTITLFASPTDRAKLAEGQSVTVNLDAGDQESPGTIVELDDNATVSGSSETYEGVVEAVEDLVGVDGAVVTIDVVVQQSVDAVVVPIAAVLSDGGQQTVRVVTPDGVIERRPIETGMLDGAYVEVVSGVVAGEYVILDIDRS